MELVTGRGGGGWRRFEWEGMITSAYMRVRCFVIQYILSSINEICVSMIDARVFYELEMSALCALHGVEFHRFSISTDDLQPAPAVTVAATCNVA